MAEFAAQGRALLAVPMQRCLGKGRQGRQGGCTLGLPQVIAKQVDHQRPGGAELGGLQGLAGNDAHLLGELADAAGLDAVVAGVVGAGSEFVDQQPSGPIELVNRQHAHVVQGRQQGGRHVVGHGFQGMAGLGRS